MNRKSIQYLYLCCSFMLVIFESCLFSSEKDKNTASLIIADISTIIKQKPIPIGMKQLFDDCNYVPLETTGDCLIDFIRNLYLTQNSIIVVSKKECLVFDRNTGNFIRKIGNYGMGPDEFPGIKNTVFDENKEILYILANDSKKLLSYDINTGNLVNNIASFNKFGILYWELIDSVNYIGSVPNYNGNAQDRFIVGNVYGDSIYTYPNHSFFDFKTDGIHYTISSFNYWTQFYRFKNNLYMRECLNDTVFRVDDLYTISPCIVFDLGKLHFPQDSRGDAETIDKIQSDYIIVGTIIETEYYLFITCDYKNKKYNIIYDKRSQEFNVVNKANNTGIENDILIGFPIFWPKYTNGLGEVINYYSASALKSFIEERSASGISDELKNFANSMKEDDNPVIVIAK